MLRLTGKVFLCSQGKLQFLLTLAFFNVLNNILFLNRKLFMLPEFEVKNFLILNHILLIFKIYVYNSRQNASVNFEALLKKIITVKNIEKKLASLNNNKLKHYSLKWQVTDAKLQIE